MKFLICLAVLAALVEVSQAYTCSGITDCLTMVSKVASASDHDDLCRGMHTALNCMSSSIADCKNQGMDQSLIDTYQSQMKNVRATVNDKCGSSGAGTVAKVSIAALLLLAILAIF